MNDDSPTSTDRGIALPPHPATRVAKPLVPFFSARDKVTSIPDLPTDLEAEILMASRENRMQHQTYSLRGSSHHRKLAGLRCLWWGWIGGHNWDRLQGLTPAGEAMLKHWLCDQEEQGNAEATKKRKLWYPNDLEVAIRKLRGEAENRKHDVRHANKVRSIDAACETTNLEHRVKTIGLLLGRGANNVDDLLRELKTVVGQIDDLKAQGEREDAATEDQIAAIDRELEQRIAALRQGAARG